MMNVLCLITTPLPLILWGLISVKNVRIATAGTPNYDSARTISYVFPDALADQIGALTQEPKKFYKAQ